MSQLLTLSLGRKLAFNDAKNFPAHIFFTNLIPEKIHSPTYAMVEKNIFITL